MGLGWKWCAGTQCRSRNTGDEEGQGRLHNGGNAYLEGVKEKSRFQAEKEGHPGSGETICAKLRG